MSILFFDLRGVPVDEADDVRELLHTNGIDFYETSAGMMGISLPAIWLYHYEDLSTAQNLFDNYQQQRAITQRALYEQTRIQNRHAGFWRHNLNNPLRFIAASCVIGLVIYLSVKWVLDLGF